MTILMEGILEKELKTNSPVNETCSNSIWNLLSHPSAIEAEKNQINLVEIRKVAEFEYGNQL